MIGQIYYTFRSAQGMLGKQIPFFQYSVKMGREMLRRDVTVTPAACKFWRLGNVTTLQNEDRE